MHSQVNVSIFAGYPPSFLLNLRCRSADGILKAGVRFMSDLRLQILKELRKCADQSISLDAFREWFVPLSMDIEQSGHPEAIELAHHIDGILAEANSAHWSDEDLRQEMADIGIEHQTPVYRAS
jgi:hypothetical protein